MVYRIVVVGEARADKSALVLSYLSAHGVTYDPTTDESFKKHITIDGKICELDIMDISGLEGFTSLRDTCIANGEGFVLVYSVTSSASFEAASSLRTAIIRSKFGAVDTPIMLVGNNSHLESERVISTEEGRNASEKWGTGFVEVSAKTRRNIPEIFVGIVQLIDQWREAHPDSPPTFRVRHRRKSHRLESCLLL